MKEKKAFNDNYYKIGFFVLAVLLVIGAIVYAIDFYGDSRYNSGLIDGQTSAVFGIANTAVNSGSVTIQDQEANASLTLFPQQSVQLAQEQIYAQIMSSAREQGFVRLFDDQGEVFLVQSETPEGFPTLEELIAQQQQQASVEANNETQN